MIKTLIIILLWGILLILCWPLAVIALFFWPIAWLLSIPFSIIGVAMKAVLALAKAILLLPARILGYRGST